MSSFQGILSFTAAARAGNFAVAARDLGVSPSAVAKNIARLETRLGVRLFHRTTRKITLTPEGFELLERSQRVLVEIEALESAAQGASSRPTGTLRISAPVVYGRRVLVPALAELSRLHSGLGFDIRFEDGHADLIADRLDAIVRMGAIDDSGAVARQIDRQPLGCYVHPRLLERFGTPSGPREASALPWLQFRLPVTGRLRPIQFFERGRRMVIEPANTLVFDDGEALVAAAAEGMGALQVPDMIAESEVVAGRLVEVLHEYAPPPLAVSLIYPSRRQVSPRVRALLDVLPRHARHP